MGGKLESIDGLTSSQREAGRLETTGMSNAEIAQTVGVDPATVSRWRRKPLYQQHLKSIMDQMDRDTIKAARIARDECLNVTLRAMRDLNDKVGRAEDDSDALCARDQIALAKLALDTYKTLSAQTGIKEVSGVEVEGGPSVVIDMSGLTLEQIDRIIDG